MNVGGFARSRMCHWQAYIGRCHADECLNDTSCKCLYSCAAISAPATTIPQLDNLTEGGGFGGSGAMACFCSPTSGHGRAVGHSTRSMHMASLSAERRGSVQRACNQAAAAAAAAEGGSAGCLAAMASIGGLVQQMGQQTPFFGTNGGGSGCGSNGDHFGSRGILAGGPGGSNGAVLGAGGTCGIGGRSLLGQWDLNAATPLCRLSSGAQQQPQVMTPAVLPFTSGYY